ncbi:MAG: AAA family ATPase [Rickettsiaceae bacterium]|nr:AAA family ATPase [Rickettsiaceae bacterium]MDP4832557.1 AAA family ATPase [Rickettsiaceae bacterium]MDP5020201.1 AAA family ATPase [Rickettsiaceae bacterium]MDP5082903.1 AAA family ATPase [Rickettsiaceae bacterium]
MLSHNLEHTLREALSIATEKKHEYATYEHLLLALIYDEDAQKALIENGVAIELLTTRLKNYIEHDLIDLVDDNSKEAKPTAGFQLIIQRAALHSQASGQRVITGVHVLAEFFFEHEAYALLCLKESNLSRHDILTYIKRLDQSITSSSSEKDNAQISLVESVTKDRQPKIDIKPSIDSKQADEQSDLEKYCVNLNERADTDAIDCLIGRQAEIQRTIEILCRRKKNNAILIGEPGVGKTAIAEGMAIRIVKKDVPGLLKDAVIYSLDIGSLIAGTKFRGDFEERIKNLLEALKKNKNAILFIDEIHTIIGAGSTTTGALDASNLLKPALAKGELRCIGSTTFKEYTNHFEKDAALVRRFQKIVVTEPDEEASLAILQGLKGYYEAHHNVTYTDAALKAAVHLSARYINDRHLPDKAIDLIDEAGSRSTIINTKKQKITITDKDIEHLLSSLLNIPQINMESNEIAQLKALDSNLQKCIFGQDEAIESLCASIKLSRAGLRKGNRPTGCYLFAGPTGVGKTELAKQLATLCNMKLLKFDMSEFSEPSSLSKLLGSSPGYVGFDQGGMLSSEVNKYPYSVVLFDEIEKAHPEIFNLLLQIMDEGTLTDSTGKNINFTHTMVILTTNVVAEKEKAAIGFNENNKDSKVIINMDAINATFSPEFRSRLDNIILFNPIDGIIEKIVSKNLKELGAQLADKKVRLTVTPAVKKYFVETCFDSNNGARTLDRVIDNKIKQAIANEILFGKLKNGGTANVDLSKKTQEITFKFTGVKKILKKQLETS